MRVVRRCVRVRRRFACGGALRAALCVRAAQLRAKEAEDVTKAGMIETHAAEIDALLELLSGELALQGSRSVADRRLQPRSVA